MKRFINRSIAIVVAVLALNFLPACTQRVTLVPEENDLVVLNGCVISACNYLAVVKAQHRLETNFWAKILLVRFANHPAGHAYCVWETEGNVYGYDRNSGSFQLPVYTRDARLIAMVLAQELSKYLHEPLSVSTADFIQANNVELYKYTAFNLSPTQNSPSVATAFGAVSLARPESD